MTRLVGSRLCYTTLLLVVLWATSPGLMAQCSLSVDATVSNDGSSSVIVGGPVTATLTATANCPPTDSSPCTINPASWSWSYTVLYASTQAGPYGNPPQGASYTVMIDPPPDGNPSKTKLHATFNQAGWWKVTPTAAVTYTDTCDGNWGPVSGTANDLIVDVIGVQKIQFQLPGGSWQDMPVEGLYVATGTTVKFQAIIAPSDASWPSGYPVWGGSCGAEGTGPTTSVTFTVPSQSMSDYHTITAACGNTVTGAIIRYGPDQATLSLDYVPEDSSSNSYVATMTYKLWVPDTQGIGQPDSDGGYAELDTVDFNQDTDTTLNEVMQYPFSNGEETSQTYVIQTGILNCANGEYGSGELNYTTPPSYGWRSGPTNERRGLSSCAAGSDSMNRLGQVVQLRSRPKRFPAKNSVFKPL